MMMGKTGVFLFFWKSGILQGQYILCFEEKQQVMTHQKRIFPKQQLLQKTEKFKVSKHCCIKDFGNVKGFKKSSSNLCKIKRTISFKESFLNCSRLKKRT
jgi:hypothetical protein